MNYIKIYYQYNEVYYKYIQIHWKNIQILWCLFKRHLSTIKNIFLYFNTHMYIFQIHYNTFLKPYTLLTYTTIPLLYSNILPYTSNSGSHASYQLNCKIILSYYRFLSWLCIHPPKYHASVYNRWTLKLSWNLSILHLFVLSLQCFSKFSWRLTILPKFCCTYHEMLIGIKKWRIFYDSHKSYWLIKYLNPKLISWDTINTCWTYIHRLQKPSLI